MCIGVLTFTWRYFKSDIDSFTLYIQTNSESEDEYSGHGMISLLGILGKFENVILYVKDLSKFFLLSKNFICYEDGEGSYRSDRGSKTYWLKCQNVRFRDLDNFMVSTLKDKHMPKTAKQWYRYIMWLNKTYGGNIYKGWEHTITTQVKNWLIGKFYLRNGENRNYAAKHELNEAEYIIYKNIKKGGFYWSNPKYIGTTVQNVYQYDASSNHISIMARKKFPRESLKEIEPDKFKQIINDDNWAWATEISFSSYETVIDIGYNLKNNGLVKDRETGRYSLCLIDPMKFVFKLFKFNDLSFNKVLAAEKGYLPNDYYQMIQYLYGTKEALSKDKDIRYDIAKFPTELPYGLSIKEGEFKWSFDFDDNVNDFVKKFIPYSFESVKNNYKNNLLPCHVGLWTLGYSNAALINLILKIKPQDVVYCDTDCVKFVNKRNCEIVAQWNSDIDKEFEEVYKHKLFPMSSNLGRWKDEGVAKEFKAVATKWYMYRDKQNNLVVKAAGANTQTLTNYLNKQKNPFNEFSTTMNVKGMFDGVYKANREHGWIEPVEYKNVKDFLIKEAKK